MTAPKTLPVRPSLESIHKQAKRLARDFAAGSAEAAARARAQLSSIGPSLSQRDAQLVLAREHGFAGWRALKAEVLRGSGRGLEWALVEARRAVQGDDVPRLKQLVAEYPALLSARDEVGSTLMLATTSYANDCADPEREQRFNRPRCAQFLIDAGAVVEPAVWQRVLDTGAAGMLRLLWGKGVLPHTLPILAALGEFDAVRAGFDEAGRVHAVVSPQRSEEVTATYQALMAACRFKHEAIALWLLERCIALDDALGRRVDGGPGRAAFVGLLCAHAAELAGQGVAVARSAPWLALAMLQLTRGMSEGDLPAFVRCLQSEPYLLGSAFVDFQVQLLEQAACGVGGGSFIEQLFALQPAVLRQHPPPPAHALRFAVEYGNAALVPLLARIWPLPDDLPHAAGTGDLARVERWFDAAGEPALGDPDQHYPGKDPQVRADLLWGANSVQRVLDVALAWACMNAQFEIASFLLEHGADIDTDWGTHEPCSILHECAIRGNYDAARFLIERGIDMTVRDHRYRATAEGWARHGAGDEAMASFLANAEQERGR